MGELLNYLSVALCLLSACALVTQALYVVRICTWLALLNSVWAVFNGAPRIRIDMHWRSIVLYVFNLVLSIICIVDAGMDKSEIMTQGFCIGYGVTFILVCLVTGALFFILPLPASFAIRGPFKSIGTMTFNVVTDDSHPITIQCWFPITKESALTKRALLWTSGHPELQLKESLKLMKTLASNNKLPAFAVKHLSLARTNSNWQHTFDNLVDRKTEKDDEKVNNKFPIAVYSHGLYGWRQIHHSACENLASEGFVVFACDHTPDSMCSRPLGELPIVFGFPTPPGLAPEVERKFFQGGLERRIQQLTTLVTHIQSDAFLQQHPNLVGKLDYDNINLWGHSYGGGTIATMCCRELPFKINSAVMLDGWMWPVPDADRKNGSQNASLLNLSAERWPFGKYQVPFRADLVKSTAANKQAQLSPPVLLDLVLRGSDHQNFVDIHLIARKFLLSRPSMLGPDLDAVQAIRAIDTILPAFFRGAAQSRQSRRGLQAEEVAVELCASAMNTTSAAAAAVDKDEKDNNSTCARNKDNAGSSTLTTTTTTTAPQQADDIATLIEVCTLGMASSVNLHDVAGASAQVKTALSEEMVSFIRKNIVPAKEMPVGYGDDKVFKKILQQQLDQFDKTDAQ